MRARGDDPMDAQVAVVSEDVQVTAKPRRRTYTAEYKRRILKEADACTTPGAIGALLRREGLYSSHLAGAGPGHVLPAAGQPAAGASGSPAAAPTAARPDDGRSRAGLWP